MAAKHQLATMGQAIQLRTNAAFEAPFNLKKLPQEIRLKIFAHDLVHYPSGNPPALLEALARDEFFADDYIRAVRLYSYGGTDMNNFRVTSSNVQAFNRMPMKQMLKIKHFTLVMNTDKELAKTNPIYLKFNKCKLKNNFESIIIDFGQCVDNGDSTTMFEWAVWAAQASSQPYRIIIRYTMLGGAKAQTWNSKYRLNELFHIQPTFESDKVTYLTCTWDRGDKILRPTRY